MDLRASFTEALKAAMRARDAARTSTVRLILARLKDTDIAARPKGVAAVPDADILQMLRGMVKSRLESIELYERGNRPELAAKEAAEVAVIESFLPAPMDAAAIAAAIDAAIAQTATAGGSNLGIKDMGIKDMGRVMAALKAAHGASLDMARAGALVRAKLGG